MEHSYRFSGDEESTMRTTHTPLHAEVYRVFALIADGLALPNRRSSAAQDNDREVRTVPIAPSHGWLDRLGEWAWRQRQRDVEAYLAKSKDVYELEARIRAMERDIPPRDT